MNTELIPLYDPVACLNARLDALSDSELMALKPSECTPRMMACWKPRKRRRFARIPKL